MPVNSNGRSNLPVANTGKSCATCPANLSTTSQGRMLGKTIGGPVCGLKNIPLSRPGIKNDTITMKHFAKDCDKYGTQVDTRSGTTRAPIEFNVALPDMNAVRSSDWEREAVTACSGCANYVPPRIVQANIGWRAGFCRAKGSLILEDRLTEYARGCEDRVFAPPGERLDEMRDTGRSINFILLAEYAADFGLPKKVDPRTVHTLNMSVSPDAYETDVPLKDHHRKMGIRAFRKLADPKGYGPPVIVPIMDAGAKHVVDGQEVPMFSDEDIARIPRSGDPENPEAYFDHNGAAYRILTIWLKLNLTPAVWGIAGTGKTELLRHLAWMMSLPFQRISITESSELDDLFGKMLYSPERGTYFQYGRIPLAWKRPNVLCLDEPNTGPPAVWQRIRPLTDDSKQMILDENANERIDKHRICYLGMAMNPAWDIRNAGAYPLADADGSRLMHIEMPLPPEDIEKTILLEALKRDKWHEDEAKHRVDTLMRMANDLRRLSDDGAIPVSWGIRSQLKVIRVRRYMGWEDSFRMGVVDAIEPQARDQILEVVRSYDDEAV